MSSGLLRLGSVGSDGGSSSATDGSEVSAGRHGDGDSRGRVLLLVRCQEGRLHEKQTEIKLLTHTHILKYVSTLSFLISPFGNTLVWLLQCLPGQPVAAPPRSTASRGCLCSDWLALSRFSVLMTANRQGCWESDKCSIFHIQHKY